MKKIESYKTKSGETKNSGKIKLANGNPAARMRKGLYFYVPEGAEVIDQKYSIGSGVSAIKGTTYFLTCLVSNAGKGVLKGKMYFLNTNKEVRVMVKVENEDPIIEDPIYLWDGSGSDFIRECLNAATDGDEIDATRFITPMTRKSFEVSEYEQVYTTSGVSMEWEDRLTQKRVTLDLLDKTPQVFLDWENSAIIEEGDADTEIEKLDKSDAEDAQTVE